MDTGGRKDKYLLRNRANEREGRGGNRCEEKRDVKQEPLEEERKLR